MANPVKLIYEFNSSANLEVQISSGTWCRVTSCDFRSSGFPRRINGEPYSGNIYYKRTNTLVKTPTKGINYPEGYVHYTSNKNR